MQSVMKRKINQHKTDSEITQVIKLPEKDIKTAIIKIFYMLKKIEEKLSMLIEDMTLFFVFLYMFIGV